MPGPIKSHSAIHEEMSAELTDRLQPDDVVYVRESLF